MIKDFFNELTGNRKLNLYPYQEKVVKYILDGSNVYLIAPTGAGKTWAALLPYLWMKKQKKTLIDRLLYVLPLRTLATMLYNDTVISCKRIFNVKILPKNRENTKDEIIITIQTGEQKNDPFFEGDIIFTTVDQCLSSYLNYPVSLPRKMANINAGAILGSLIVFDEFHLLEPDKSMYTTIEMLSRVKPFSQFLIMTATLSIKSINLLRNIIDGKVVQLTADEIFNIPSQKDKKRFYHWIDKPISIDNILNVHSGKRSIVITNTVSKAQDIYKELKTNLKNSSTKLFLLHNRFFPEDRKKTESELRAYFGKDANKTDAILVTTQVIEAGIDISADNLHTELAPMNSIIQRAGRCARYEGIRGTGDVWIYELEKNEKGMFKLGPYHEKYQESLIDATRSILKCLDKSGEVINFQTELQWIDKIHSKQEKSYLELYQRDLRNLKNKIHETMDGKNETAIRDLIRDTSSINVIISDNPHSLKFNKEKWPQMLSIPRNSIYKLMEFFNPEEIVAWYPDESSNIIDDDSDISFGWVPITSIEQLNDISWLIVINPKYASYSSEVGLQIGVKGHLGEVKYFDRPAKIFSKITYETYKQHAMKIIEEGYKLVSLHRNACNKLSKYYQKSSKELESLISLCCAIHDVGKLSKKWQELIREWQKLKNPEKLSDEPIAHSDYDPEVDFEQKKGYKVPPHSAEGAYAIGKWLSDIVDRDFLLPILTAITRHHGAFTDSLNEFQLIENAEKWVAEILPMNYGNRITLLEKPDNISKNCFKDNLLCFSKNPDDEKLWPFYVFLIRILRLADQYSQKWEEYDSN